MIPKGNGKRRNGASRRGFEAQGMVEFALILPVLLVTLFMLVELARLLHAWMAVENGARFGVRYAVTGEFDPWASTKCPGGVCPDVDAEIDARLESIRDSAIAGSASILRDFTVDDVTENGFFKTTICKEGTLIDPGTHTEKFTCSQPEYPGDPGQNVIVVVEFTHPLITPILTGIVPNIHISSEREAVVETFRVVQAGSGAPGADPPPPDPPVEPPEPPPPPDPCENILLDGPDLDDKSSDNPDKMWKLEFALYNNNSFPGTISWFELDWTRHGDLDLYRWVYRYEGTSMPRKIIPGQTSGPLRQTNLPFPDRPQNGFPGMYGEFCHDINQCYFDEGDLAGAPAIPDGEYTFTITGEFDFGEYGTCPLTLPIITGRAAPRTGGGGGGGGGDPWEPPDPPPSDGDPPPGGGGGGPSD